MASASDHASSHQPILTGLARLVTIIIIIEIAQNMLLSKGIAPHSFLLVSPVLLHDPKQRHIDQLQRGGHDASAKHKVLVMPD